MALVDHLGISVTDLAQGIRHWDPVLTALGYTRQDGDGASAWNADGETEIILYAARAEGTGPHRHGDVGWQHLAFSVPSRAEVDGLHATALASGWSAVREPKDYPRFSPRYYASFVEDADGIRIEFMVNPPREA